MADIKLEGIGTIYNVPEKSSDFLSKIADKWREVYNYFKDSSDVDKANAAYEIVNEVWSVYETGELSTNFTYSSGKTIYDGFRFDVESVLNNEDYDTFYLNAMPYYLSTFSVFEFANDDTQVMTHVGSAGVVKSGIYEQFEDDKISGYRFKKSNNLFSLLDNFIGSSWRNNNSTVKYGVFYASKIKSVSTEDLLVKGYYKNNNTGDSYVLFPNENDIKEFIYECIYNLDASNISVNGSRFDINMIQSLSKAMSEEMLKCLKSVIEKIEHNSAEDVYPYSVGDCNVQVFNANDLDLIKSYDELFTKSMEEFETKVNSLKKAGTSDIYKNEEIKNFVKKICGGTLSGTEYVKDSDAIKIGSYDRDSILDFFRADFDRTKIAISGNKFIANLKEVSNLTDSKQKNNEEWIGFTTLLNIGDPNYKSLNVNVNSFLSKMTSLMSENASYKVPLCFYETTIFSEQKEKEAYKVLDKANGNLIAKLAFLSFFIVSDFSVSQTQQQITIKFKFKQRNTTTTTVKINNEDKKSFLEVYEELADAALKKINETLSITATQQETQEIQQETKDTQASFDQYVKSRISSSYFTEKSYFYITDSTGKKRVPFNPFVDIEFRVLKVGSSGNSVDWIPVTSMRTEKSRESNDFVINGDQDNMYEMHAGSYFDSFDLNDNGGVKEISLVLKSVNDMNLENIIYNSLAADGATVYTNGSGNLSAIQKMLNDTESNFRIRFGYRDVSAKDASNNETAITTSDNSSKDFIDRTKTGTSGGDIIVKPVLIYPWTYFKITGLSSNITNGEDTYTITAVSSGSYILNNMTLIGADFNFKKNTDKQSKDFLGTPRNVIGKIAKWVTIASTDCDNDSSGSDRDIKTARICFLGDGSNTIFTGFDEEKKYKYALSGGGTLNGGDIEDIEEKFLDTSSDSIASKNFNITNDSKSLSIKEILDSLSKWLPSRVYYIAKKENSDKTVAIHIPYKSIYEIENFFSSVPFKTENITYQIIEADACIYPDGGTPAGDYHKVYFIRMYYEGPGLTEDENGIVTSNEYLRIYNYRSTQEQVIENIDISSNDKELGNAVSSVTLLGSGTPIVFKFDDEKGSFTDGVTTTESSMEIDYSKIKTIKKEESWFNSPFADAINPKLTLCNSKYVTTSSSLDDGTGITEIPSTYTEAAALFFSDQQNKQYEGEITILGDPFYYFDSSLEAGKYEIYLQMNRVANRKNYEVTPSRYSGIYFIKGIKHSIDSSGKYTTTLSVAKRVFGSGTSST